MTATSEPTKISMAEFKRRLTPGMRLECVQHRLPGREGTKRTIDQVRTVDVIFKVDGGPDRYHMRFGDIDEVRANDTDFEIFMKGESEPWLRLRTIAR